MEENNYLTTNKVVAIRKDKNEQAVTKKMARALETNDPQEIIDALTTKQRLFCEEFVKDLNASQAVMRAGYDTKYPNRIGNQLLNNPGVKIATDALLLQKNQNNDVTKDYVLRKIVAQVEKADAKGNPGAALRGLELLAKHLGMFIERKEISGPDGAAIAYEEKVKQDAADLESAVTRLAARGGKTELAIVSNS
jgi:phage terminase small subunit